MYLAEEEDAYRLYTRPAVISVEIARADEGALNAAALSHMEGRRKARGHAFTWLRLGRTAF